MKKLFAIICFIAMATVAVAQSAEEILARMEAEMDKHDESEGVAMTMDIKMFILGTMSTSMKGIDMTIRDISFGVTEQQVTFDPKTYPNATIVDNR